MKKLIYISFITILFIACKQNSESKPTTPDNTENQISITQKIANAHGFENWRNVSEIAFNFNEKRNWIWHPKTNNITLYTEKDTLNYNRKSIDSISQNADKAFINDKFWLLVPFQLIWDKGTTFSKPIKAESPISKSKMNKMTLTYPIDGGYTPGDAYDIYYGDDYLIREWVYRKGNQTEASLTTTFENYQDFNGIKIALNHKKGDGKWNLSFSNVKVILD